MDAVIVAGALYANRWHSDAWRFVRRNAEALRGLPVWLVSSGPLDDSAERHDLAPTKQVRKWADAVGARGHVTFGGRLASDAKGFPASAMAKTNAGDWRDRAHVQRWVETVVKPAPLVDAGSWSLGCPHWAGSEPNRKRRPVIRVGSIRT